MLSNQVFIFTEIINCAEIGYIMLKSFLKHHPNREINVFGTPKDFELLHELNENSLVRKVNIETETEIVNGFSYGHLGTSRLWARIFKYIITCNYIIKIDSDLYFKSESLSLIEDEFKNGYDIVGSRRCYKNNPANAPVYENAPDAISTYFMGFNLRKINQNQYDEETLARMIQGVYNPLGWSVLDFFDPMTFWALNNGAKIKFLDSNLIGGQDENGSKKNNYPLNMHMDNGKHLIHFGGVGSGLAYSKGSSNPEKSYADWALGRWALFAKVFYNKDIPCPHETKYLGERWVFGNYDENILNQVKEQLT